MSTSDDTDLRPGDCIGPYQIERKLGSGGMAVVYKARTIPDNRLVAVKVARHGMSASVEEEGARIKQLLTLNHPNIVKILPGAAEDGKTAYRLRDKSTRLWYFSMEYMPGGSLADWLKTHKRLTLPQALMVVKQIGAALDAAHRVGLLHLDVKPSNILFAQDPTKTRKPRAVLSDFGIARSWGHGQGSTEPSSLTPQYASPEQAKSYFGQLDLAEDIGPASDLYSLVTALYEMVSGRLPFASASNEPDDRLIYLGRVINNSPRLPIPGTPDGLTRILTKGLAKKPSERYQTAAELVADLRRLRWLGSISRTVWVPILSAIAGLLVGFAIGRVTTLVPPPPVTATATPVPTSVPSASGTHIPLTVTSTPVPTTRSSTGTLTPIRTTVAATSSSTPTTWVTATRVPPTPTWTPIPTAPTP